MKRFYLFLSLSLIITVGFIMSCSGNKDASMTKMIPKNAYLVVNMNFGSLHKKGELKDFEKTNLYTQIISLMDWVGPNEKNYVKDILTNSDATGLNLKDEVYCFVTETYFGFITPIKDKNDFNNFLKKHRDKNSKNTEPRKIDKFLAVGEDNLLVAWDDNVFYTLIGIDNQAKEKIEADFKLFTSQKEENSIMSNPKFDNFSKNKKDISLLMDFEKMMNYSLNMANRFGRDLTQEVKLDEAIKLYKDSYSTTFIDFNNDEIFINLESHLSEEIQKLVNYEKINRGNLSDKLLKIFPKNSLAVIAAAVNPSEAVKSYKSIAQKILPNSNNNAMEIINAISNFSERLDGEIVATMVDLSENPGSLDEFSSLYSMNEVPIFAIALGTKDNNILETIEQNMKGKLTKVGNYYELPEIDEFSSKIYAINTNNILLISNDISQIKAAQNASIEDNLTASVYAKELKNGSFGYINLNFDNFPKVLKSKVLEGESSIILSKFNVFDVAYIETDKSGKSAKSVIKLKKKSQNSFLTILKTFENMATL